MSKMSQTVYEDPRGEFRTVNQLADDAAEALRGINHLTFSDRCVRYPSEVYTLLADLGRLAHLLPQALRQVDSIVSGWVEDGHVSIDDSEYVGHPEAAAAAVSVYLEDAGAHAGELGRLLDKAQQALGAASWSGPDREGG